MPLLAWLGFGEHPVLTSPTPSHQDDNKWFHFSQVMKETDALLHEKATPSVSLSWPCQKNMSFRRFAYQREICVSWKPKWPNLAKNDPKDPNIYPKMTKNTTRSQKDRRTHPSIHPFPSCLITWKKGEQWRDSWSDQQLGSKTGFPLLLCSQLQWLGGLVWTKASFSGGTEKLCTSLKGVDSQRGFVDFRFKQTLNMWKRLWICFSDTGRESLGTFTAMATPILRGRQDKCTKAGSVGESESPIYSGHILCRWNPMEWLFPTSITYLNSTILLLATVQSVSRPTLLGGCHAARHDRSALLDDQVHRDGGCGKLLGGRLVGSQRPRLQVRQNIGGSMGKQYKRGKSTRLTAAKIDLNPLVDGFLSSRQINQGRFWFLVAQKSHRCVCKVVGERICWKHWKHLETCPELLGTFQPFLQWRCRQRPTNMGGSCLFSFATLVAGSILYHCVTHFNFKVYKNP